MEIGACYTLRNLNPGQLVSVNYCCSAGYYSTVLAVVVNRGPGPRCHHSCGGIALALAHVQAVSACGC